MINSSSENLRKFGNCTLDVERRVLWFADRPVQLQLKSIELLCLLVSNGGQVVSKEEIWSEVWDDSFVEETNLTHNIYLLRQKFKDLGEGSLIETVPRRGYRFTGTIENKNGGPPAAEPATGSANSPAFYRSAKIGRRQMTAGLAGVVLLAGAAFAFIYFFGAAVSTDASDIKSLAVLPFRPIDPKSETEHAGLGLADVVITRLSSIRSLNVRPTSAIAAFENHKADSISLGKQLNVDAVLEGVIHHTGDHVRITMRLLRVSDGKPVWAGQIEKSLQDEFKLHNEIALQIVDALALSLTATEKDALNKRYTQNADAYQLYLDGRYEWNKRTSEGMVKSQKLFRDAIEKDPDFALAYSGLADTLAMDKFAPESRTAISKALELDPNLAEPHASKGFVLMIHDWNWAEAEIEFKKAIELNPNYAAAHHWYAELLAIEGRNDEAKAEMLRALEINPVSYNYLADLGQIYYFSHEYGLAKEYCLKALEINPEFVMAHQYLHYIYLKTGEHDKAVEAIISRDKVFGEITYPSPKQKEAEEAVIDKQRQIFQQGGIRKWIESDINNALKSPQDNNSFYLIANRFTFLGEEERALGNLEKAFEVRAFLSAFVKADPIFDSIRSQPRYIEILRKMNLK